MKTIGFFNSKSGVGKTTLVYHIAWMLSEMGIPVIAADLDPQANLTSVFLSDERLEEIWTTWDVETGAGAVQPLIERGRDFSAPTVEMVGGNIGLVLGDLALSRYEDSFARAWAECLSGDMEAFRLTGAFHLLVRTAAEQTGAELALVDVGPNLGAINRAALIACDEVVMPLAADFVSLMGLRHVGEALRTWRAEWRERLDHRPAASIDLPDGKMSPLGYVIRRDSVRLDRPIGTSYKWMGRVAREYHDSVRTDVPWSDTIDEDPWCLGSLKDFRALTSLARDVRKPMFLLKPADGAFGGHQQAVLECYREFRTLTERILRDCGVAF